LCFKHIYQMDTEHNLIIDLLGVVVVVIVC
jgi:hypothetical protein